MADGTTSPGARPRVGRIRSEQDHADLLTYHMSVLRKEQTAVATAQGPVDEAKVDLSEAQESLTKAFNQAKADLGRGYSRKYLEGLLADSKERNSTLVDLEKQRARDKTALHQPVFGVQPELFNVEETPTYVRDEMAWHHQGFMRGLAGELEVIQKGDPPTFLQAIQKGYNEGQELTQLRVQRAMEIRKAESQVDANAAPIDLNKPLPEPGTPEHEAALEESARRARETLGDGTTKSQEAEDEAAAIERAKASLDGMGQGGDDGEQPAAGEAQPEEEFQTSEADLAKQTTRRSIKDAKAGATSGETQAQVH